MSTEPYDLGTLVQAPADELDIAAVPELRARLTAASRPGAHVVLDVRQVVFLDSSALAVVLAADRRLAATGGSLRLAGARAEVRRVLRICGLSELVLPSSGGRLQRTCRAAQLVR